MKLIFRKVTTLIFKLFPRYIQRMVTDIYSQRRPADFFPNFDNILVGFLYRFPWVRNKFLKFDQIFFKDNLVGNSKQFDFAFSQDELISFEKNGITTFFKTKKETLQTIYHQLNKSYLDWNGTLVKKTVTEILNMDDSNFEMPNASYVYLGMNKQLIDIATCPSLINFVSGYLRSSSLTFEILAWWSFPSQDSSMFEYPNYDQARRYHFDHLGRRTCKVFIYLTDVDIDNGPHSYIKNSHIKKPFMVSLKLLRLSSSDLEKYMKKDDDWLIITGEVGKSFLMDPFGLHCGIPPKIPRLIFEIAYNVGPFSYNHFSTNIVASQLH